MLLSQALDLIVLLTLNPIAVLMEPGDLIEQTGQLVILEFLLVLKLIDGQFKLSCGFEGICLFFPGMGFKFDFQAIDHFTEGSIFI